ncbi:MAG: hypothetical protein ICV73_23625 [Acetobacteraceae bacterium]|nr:hypothetical protein [Acetobacteraceae bacterium]
MKPMQPMRPMEAGPAWWPEGLGQPASSGAQNGTRYAFFPDRRRLAVQGDGRVLLYDTGDRRIGGVSQNGGGDRPLVFTSQAGEVTLDQMRHVD